ncbi:threonine synthase [Thermogemmatispora sp.]|uniref:threonine synthase n=1 Tax=Thermogemmatispora sp. TaxID=1968838 RepID=UPI00261E0048|nr:threonine synthase [Thermogemmatispora sp.]
MDARIDHQKEIQLADSARQALEQVRLRCVGCQALYPVLEPGRAARYRCDCGEVLDVEIPLRLPKPLSPQAGTAQQTYEEAAVWRRLFAERAMLVPGTPGAAAVQRSGVWRYRELILPIPEEAVISRAEGNTTLYAVGSDQQQETQASPGLRRIGEYAGLAQLYLKHEGENPTGSFKDRGMVVGVTMARLMGARAVACASTGNTSASLASYAALAGLQALVFLPAGQVAGGKLAQTLAYGAYMVQINGDFDAAMQLVEQVCDELGIYLLNSLNPFRVEGQKAIAFELLQQLNWQAPDWLVLPAGNLGNTSALGKAFRQAHKLGLISRLPRLAAIQAAGANPFYLSYREGFARRHAVQAQTVASAIKIGNPVSYARARLVIEECAGLVEEVSDPEILEAKAVIDRAGIGCEPASAATLAGIRKLVRAGIIKPNERVVAVLTGNLLKDHQTGIPRAETVSIDPDLASVRRTLDALGSLTSPSSGEDGFTRPGAL